jgi:hypothetical protein
MDIAINIAIVFLNSLVLKTYDLPPILTSYVAQNQSYRAKSVGNGGHFEIQDGGQTLDGKKCYQWISDS